MSHICGRNWAGIDMFGNWPKITLGRISGIPIRVDATFVLVPVFLINGISASLIGAFWPAIVAGTAGIFLSILLHELGHALVSKSHQVGIKEVVVGGFYGYASFKKQAIPRGILIRILAAGPLVNLGIFVALWLSLSTPPVSELALFRLTPFQMALTDGGFFVWLRATTETLALLNLIMAIFNLLPAFPLDGGQILGHLLDRIISTQASRQIVAGLSIVIGAAAFVAGMGLSLVLTVIGLLIVLTNLRRFRRKRAS
jgi:Zn-dependent protease